MRIFRSSIIWELEVFVRKIAVVVLAVVSLSSIAAAQSSDEKAVLAVVNKMFDGMRNADSAAVRSVFAAGARFAGIDDRNKPATVRYDTVGGWINGILNTNNSHYHEGDVTPQRAELVHSSRSWARGGQPRLLPNKAMQASFGPCG